MSFFPARLSRPYVCKTCKTSLQHARKRFTTATGTKLDIYDAVILGGGPVGLGLLAALKSSPVTAGLRIALLESQDLAKAEKWTPTAESYSNRVSSITPLSKSFLEGIGAWQHVDDSRAQPYDEMKVWDGSTGSQIQFDWSAEANKYNSIARSVAIMIENANLNRAILSRLKELDPGCSSILSNTTVSSIACGDDNLEGFNLSSWPVLSLLSSCQISTGPRQIAARLLIGADGANSPVRNFASISSKGWDFGRHGVVATMSASPNPDRDFFPITAFQRFVPSLGGPIALLPLPENNISLVWSTTPQNAAYLKALSSASFVTFVNAAFRLGGADLKYMLTLPASSSSSSSFPDAPGLDPHTSELRWRLPHTPSPPFQEALPHITHLQPSTVASFPLRHRHASTYVSPRVALVGDAAHTIHPLAGQGLNLGLADVAALARNIAAAVECGRDIGDLMSLETYNTERWGRNAAVGGVCDGLHRLYGFKNGPVAWARSLGLDAINAIPVAKEWLMRRAEG